MCLATDIGSVLGDTTVGTISFIGCLGSSVRLSGAGAGVSVGTDCGFLSCPYSSTLLRCLVCDSVACSIGSCGDLFVCLCLAVLVIGTKFY